MPRNAGGEIDTTAGHETLKDLECHAKAFRIHLCRQWGVVKDFKR